MMERPNMRPIATIAFLAGLAPVLFVFLSYLVPGKQAHFAILDNLEAEPLFRDILARDARVSPGDGMIQQAMNGLPRACLPSDLNVSSILHRLLPPYPAYMVNMALVMLMGYVGMWLLLRRQLIREAHPFIAAVVAACFASLPLYPEYGISVTGQPLLLLAFIWISERRNYAASAALIALFVLWSSMYLVGVFAIAAFSAFALGLTIRERKIHFPLLMAIAGLGVGYLVVEYRLIMESFVLKSFQPHRLEFVSPPPISFRDALGSALTYLLQGFYHAPTFSRWMLPPLFLAAGLAGLQIIRRKSMPETRPILTLTATICFIALFCGFTHWMPVEDAFSKVSLFNQFNRDRFFFLLPVCWYALLALGMGWAWRYRMLRYAVPVALLLQLAFILTQHEDLRTNLHRIGKTNVPARADDQSSFSWRTFFAEELMASIQRKIGRPMDSYRIASIGIKPAPSLHHGFHTLDFYNNFYRLDYKHQFRRIMERELAKSEKNRKYFDEWGNRCELFVAETGDTLHNLELNMDAFRELGGEYLLSVPYIDNANELDLELLERYEATEYPSVLHLYHVLPARDTAAIAADVPLN